ncbi:hypothetical protein M9H77_15855 [Catharanthus roseus]|uniref:Uncharacterized protein n=1 Tax=Catharanthus roseus TaxID=4058 RepID=A0ACC0B0S2_CATRO|nr:hypothetical protein M9H77_15855 [Catharanthus roseus]
MDNSIFRNKFWFVFFVLFVFWYLLLYGFDWSFLPGLSSITLDHDKSIQSLFVRSNPDVVETNNSQDSSENTTNFLGKQEIFVNTTSAENDVDIEGLEKELEPLLGKYEDEDENYEKCKGRYIYVHNLPSCYNQDLIKNCKLLNQWTNMCPSLVNMGLGPDLGNPQRIFLNKGWFNTHQFNLEVIFHNRMKQYDCLTNDSSKAAAIFVPYYAGLDVSRYLWSSKNASVRDYDSVNLVKWLKERPEWKRMWGKDHFLVAGRITWDFRRGTNDDSGWGNNLMRLPESQNITMLTIESSPWHRNDFAIPYPTYFHPSSDNDVLLWQSKMKRQKRKNLFCFAGAPRPNMVDSIRDEIMEQCKTSRRKCRLLECTNNRNKCHKPVYLMKMFQTSIFCLQPSGDSFTRRSTFDSILAGCIPVFFSPASAYVQYLWHLPKEFSKYSVLISEDDVKNKTINIDNMLSQIPRSKVSAMREEAMSS